MVSRWLQKSIRDFVWFSFRVNWFKEYYVSNTIQIWTHSTATNWKKYLNIAWPLLTPKSAVSCVVVAWGEALHMILNRCGGNGHGQTFLMSIMVVIVFQNGGRTNNLFKVTSSWPWMLALISRCLYVSWTCHCQDSITCQYPQVVGTIKKAYDVVNTGNICVVDGWFLNDDSAMLVFWLHVYKVRPV